METIEQVKISVDEFRALHYIMLTSKSLLKYDNKEFWQNELTSAIEEYNQVKI